MNTGLTIRRMDLAASSAIAAARAAHTALEKGTFGQEAMDGYPRDLAESFVGKDLATYAKAPAFLENERMYTQYGPLLADILHDVYDLDLSPRRHIVRTATDAFKKSGLRLRSVIRDAVAGVRAL